jgi:hypothetical protein
MAKKPSAPGLPRPENLAPLVCAIRGEKVLLDADLAALYGVATKVFNQAVREIASGSRRISCFS